MLFCTRTGKEKKVNFFFFFKVGKNGAFANANLGLRFHHMVRLVGTDP